MENEEYFAELNDFLKKVPAVSEVTSSSLTDGHWWIKFIIDIDHELAWKVVQEIAHVLNYLSLDERLPTSFYPVSPPPYLNGGPDSYLSWIIENTDGSFSPNKVVEWMASRMPDPIDDLEEWED